jgi:hypothetical protein
MARAPAPHRKKLKGDPATWKQRLCLGGCDKMFLSEGNWHRVCPKCLDRQRQAETPEPTYSVARDVWL